MVFSFDLTISIWWSLSRTDYENSKWFETLSFSNSDYRIYCVLSGNTLYHLYTSDVLSVYTEYVHIFVRPLTLFAKMTKWNNQPVNPLRTLQPFQTFWKCAIVKIECPGPLIANIIYTSIHLRCYSVVSQHLFCNHIGWTIGNYLSHFGMLFFIFYILSWW